MTKVNKLTWNFITESNNWSIYQDGYEICKRFNNYNIKTFISKRVKIKKIILSIMVPSICLKLVFCKNLK